MDDDFLVQTAYGRSMATRIRVLATPAPAPGRIQKLNYSVEIADDLDPHAPPFWSCGHKHADPHSAYQCGLDWLQLHGEDVPHRQAG